jgi:hypothetical protein
LQALDHRRRNGDGRAAACDIDDVGNLDAAGSEFGHG